MENGDWSYAVRGHYYLGLTKGGQGLLGMEVKKRQGRAPPPSL